MFILHLNVLQLVHLSKEPCQDTISPGYMTLLIIRAKQLRHTKKEKPSNMLIFHPPPPFPTDDTLYMLACRGGN